MESNKNFSLKRFNRFLCADLRLNKKSYLYYFAGLTIAIYLILLLGMSRSYYDNESYAATFIVGLVGLGAFIGEAFPELKNKVKTANYLLLPASTFEKVVTQFLIRFLFGSSLFLLIFWVDAHLARETILHTKLAPLAGFTITSFHYSSFFQPEMMETPWEKLFAVMAFVSTGTYLFAIRLFFRRFALVKTVIVGIGLFFLLICGMALFSHLFYPESTAGLSVHLPIYEVVEGLSNYALFFFGIFYFAWLFLLPLAYFKLKEKQV